MNKIVDKVKGVLKRERAIPPPPRFPMLKRDQVQLSQQAGGFSADHIRPRQASQQLVFPELKAPAKAVPKAEVPVEKHAPDVDSIINVIYDEVKKTDGGEERGIPKKGLLAEERNLFFEKIERLLKETDLSEADLRRFVEHDLMGRMREFHKKKRAGEPYVFDQADFHGHVMKKIDHLKELEHAWEMTGLEIDGLKEELEKKEAEIGKHLGELKGFISQSASFEKTALLHAARLDTAHSGMVKGEGLVPHPPLSPHPSVPQPFDPLPTGLPTTLPSNVVDEKKEVVFQKELPREASAQGASGPVKSSVFLVKDKSLPRELSFEFSNGHRVASLKELKEALLLVPHDVLDYHINISENHFAPWVAYFDSALQEAVSRMTSAEELAGFLKTVSFE